MDRFVKRKQTIEKRKHQVCKVFKCKFDNSHFSKSTINHLNNLFKESKWFYNYCISQEYLNNVGEILSSAFMKALSKIYGIHVSKMESLNQEAMSLNDFGSSLYKFNLNYPNLP